MACREVTAQLVGSLPRGNIRVPPTEFVLLWRLAEHLAESGRADRYVGGVAATCRWLACAAVPVHPWGLGASLGADYTAIGHGS
jgi:hypothetical protein